MNQKQATYFVNTLGSKHQSLQPALRQLVRGEKFSDAQLEAINDGDSRLTAVVPILRAINCGTANDETIAAVNALDSFGAPLQPLLLALVAGLKD
jgi:hypothetical protein